MARVSYRVTVSGLVQGVSFRASMRDVATRHGVDGWVTNRSDGKVEALIQGEETEVERLLEWMRVGPPGAAVTSLEKFRLDGHQTMIGFRILVQRQGGGTAPNR